MRRYRCNLGRRIMLEEMAVIAVDYGLFDERKCGGSGTC